MEATFKGYYNKYIHPHACTLLITGLGVYFLTPKLAPSVVGLPLLNRLGDKGVEALLAGIYASSAMGVCNVTGLVKIL